MYNLALNAKRGILSGSLIWEHADKVYTSGDIANEQKLWGVYGSYDEVNLLNMKLACKLNGNASISYGCTNMLDKEYYKGEWTGKADGRRHIVEVTTKF